MPPKHAKGILGVRKDPKKKILFSFGGRGAEDWLSDDSEDSDYCPSSDEYGPVWLSTSSEKGSPNKERRPRKKLKKAHGDSASSSKSTTSSSSTSPSTPSTKSQKKSKELGRKIDRKQLEVPQKGSLAFSANELCWANGLPWHILQKIFRYIVDAEGCLPFLCRAAKVCRFWRDVAYSAALWQHVDLSYGWIKSNETTLRWLCENMFCRLLSIDLGTWKNLTNSGLELLSHSCPDLEYAGLSYCTKFNSEGLRFLIDGCKKLKGLDLTSCGNDAVSSPVLKHLIEKRGTQLTKLCLSKNMIRGFQSVFKMICAQCLNLEELRLNKVELSSDVLFINIEQFQAGCPRLRLLELSLTAFRASSATQAAKMASPGFPLLEEVSLATDTSTYSNGVDNDFLFRLLKNSPKLRLVDLRGSSSIKCQMLQDIPATDVEHLYVSLSSVAKYAGIEIIMSKWLHSLRDLDLSWNLYPGMSLDCAIQKLCSKPAHSALEILNLAGTAISCARVKSLLSGCPKLQSLNLCSCRGLPRGMKSEFRGPDLDRLRLDIDRFLEEEREAVNG